MRSGIACVISWRPGGDRTGGILPLAGGVDFSFRFRPRFAMRARAAASSLYDYYNPEAQTVVMPV